MRDDRTSKGWPLPYRTNSLADDVERIRNSFIAINAAVIDIENSITQLNTEINTKINEDINTKISELESKLEKQNVYAKLGLYIDDDGDICQDEEAVSDREFATDDEVKAMLDEIYGS